MAASKRGSNLRTRPNSCVELLSEDIAFPGWEHVSANLPRFYVDGFFWFLSRCRRSDVLFLTESVGPAMERMADTDWTAFPAPWPEVPSYNQFRHVKNRQPLLFYKAVQVILTCETALVEAARRERSPTGASEIEVLDQIYSHMRIVPAVFNIDRFSQTYDELKLKYPTRIGDILRQAGQKDERLLDDIADGYCVTGATARALHAAIAELDRSLTLGEVRFEPGRKKLGRKRASQRESVALS